MKAPKEIQRLVENFDIHLEAYKSGSYNETQVRVEYMNPLFTALGWDIDNKSGFAPGYQDVKHEYTLKAADGTKAPDYCFRIGGVNKFFLETKKPSVRIEEGKVSAFQIRRYAWSQSLPLGILTNFAEFAVYNCSIKPRHTDKASVARIEYFEYGDYQKKWDYIQSIFSKEAIQKGSFDTYITSDSRKKGTMTVDQAFLKDMEGWRDLLARNIALRNQNLDTKALNHLVQATIDRIVFLRICEDREIEEYGRLQRLLKSEGIYSGLCEFFKQADDKYNSGLFHFKDEKGRGLADQLSLKLKVDDKPLNEIIRRLYYPESPYVFSQIPAEILGQVYEKFLGKLIRLTPGHQAKVEEKPEVRKAGGVYYTPKYIVDYIVKNTVGELLKGKTPAQAKKLRILDPACGSGSFLIGAYHYLLDWYCSAYAKESNKHKKLIYKNAGNEWQLGTQEKKDILLKNIYGADIDRQAVEVTKLSLLLKVLEDESKDTLQSQMQLFHERALSDLSNNIKCGNSLIGTDFFVGKNLELFNRDEIEKINAFDWDAKDGFAEIMKAGGFDAVIGNPPYVRIHEIEANSRDYLKKYYFSALNQFDLYQLFYEKGLVLLKNGALLGFIASNKFCITNYGKNLRDIIFYRSRIQKIVDNSEAYLFKEASTYPYIFILEKSSKVIKRSIVNIYKDENGNIRLINQMPQEELTHGNDLNFSFHLLDGSINLIKKIESISDLNQLLVYRGRGTSKNLSLQDSKKSVRSITNKEIKRYGLKDAKYYRRKDLFNNDFEEKIVMKKICFRLEAALDENGDINPINTVYVVKSFENNYSLKFLLGLLNSRLLSVYARKKYAATGMRGGYIELRVFEIGTLPVIAKDKIKNSDVHKMTQLVDQMLDTQKKLHAGRSEQYRKHYQQKADILDKQIDTLVHELYELTPGEIKIVEGELNEQSD